MSAIFVRRLKQAGFTDEQAELLDVELHNSDILATKRDLKELETVLKQDIKTLELITKHDIKELETELKHQIELLRADTGKQIAECKSDLIRWVVGVGILQSSLIIGVLLKVGHLV